MQERHDRDATASEWIAPMLEGAVDSPCGSLAGTSADPVRVGLSKQELTFAKLTAQHEDTGADIVAVTVWLGHAVNVELK